MPKLIKKLFLLPVVLTSLAVMLLSSSAFAGISVSIGGYGGGIGYDSYHSYSSYSIGIGSGYYPYYGYRPYYYGYRPYYNYYGYNPYYYGYNYRPYYYGYGYRPYYSYPRNYYYGRSYYRGYHQDHRFDNRGRSR